MTLNLSFNASARLPAFNAKVTGSYSSNGAAPSSKAYISNGYVMNHNGYLANPTRSAQVAANNAGALTRAEASRMGLPLGGRQ